MRYKIISLVIVCISCFSCNSDDGATDDNYPTTIYKMDSEVLQDRKNTLHKDYVYLVTSLNEFGFTHHGLVDTERPPVKETLTETGAIDVIKDFIFNNKDITGVDNTEELNFEIKNISEMPVDGSTIWNFRTSNQVVEGIEVLQSKIVVHVFNGEIRWCVGNWYPEIYIPDNFNYDEGKSKSFLLNKVMGHVTIAGVPYDTPPISQKHLDSSDSKLVVLPIKAEDKIELRITWEINVEQPIYYKFYIDVMTGEILQELPTIIS